MTEHSNKDFQTRVEDLELKVEGKCPECKRMVKGWKAVFGFFAPEWWASMREVGIDPATGHLQTCKTRPQIK